MFRWTKGNNYTIALHVFRPSDSFIGFQKQLEINPQNKNTGFVLLDLCNCCRREIKVLTEIGLFGSIFFCVWIPSVWEHGPQTYLPLQMPGHKAGLPRLWAQRCALPVADIFPGGWSYRAASSPAGLLNTDCQQQREETETEGKGLGMTAKLPGMQSVWSVWEKSQDIWFLFDLISLWGIFRNLSDKAHCFQKQFLQILDYGLFFLYLHISAFLNVNIFAIFILFVVKKKNCSHI